MKQKTKQEMVDYIQLTIPSRSMKWMMTKLSKEEVTKRYQEAVELFGDRINECNYCRQIHNTEKLCDAYCRYIEDSNNELCKTMFVRGEQQ